MDYIVGSNGPAAVLVSTCDSMVTRIQRQQRYRSHMGILVPFILLILVLEGNARSMLYRNANVIMMPCLHVSKEFPGTNTMMIGLFPYTTGVSLTVDITQGGSSTAAAIRWGARENGRQKILFNHVNESLCAMKSLRIVVLALLFTLLSYSFLTLSSPRVMQIARWSGKELSCRLAVPHASHYNLVLGVSPQSSYDHEVVSGRVKIYNASERLIFSRDIMPHDVILTSWPGKDVHALILTGNTNEFGKKFTTILTQTRDARITVMLSPTPDTNSVLGLSYLQNTIHRLRGIAGR